MEEKKTFLNQVVIYSLLAIILLIAAMLRYRLLGLPLERDEGEYALMGQLILKGIPPYEMAYNMKLPGVYYMYALMMAIFGQTNIGIHLGLLVMNLMTIFLLFFSGKKMGNAAIGLYAAASYAILSLSPSHLALAAHATHFIVFFCLGGLVSILMYKERPTMLWLTMSVFCFGLSFIMKQQAVFLMLFGLVAFGVIEWQRKPIQAGKAALRLLAFGSSMALPYLLVILSSWMTGTFDQFWHWTMEYAREYASIKTNDEIFKNLMSSLRTVTDGMLLFWLAGAIGLIVLFFVKAIRPYRWLIILFALLTFACVVPGYYFRRHYYIVFLPALTLLIGIGLIFFHEQLKKLRMPWLQLLPILGFGFIFFHTLYMKRDYFFNVPPLDLCKMIYATENPFVESMALGEFIKSHTTPEDKIAVLGSEPQIYFYSDRLPATGYIYAYPLTEAQAYSKEMRKDMMAEVEAAKPKYLIFINSSFSWGSSSENVQDVMNWYMKIQSEYKMVGVIDQDPTGRGTFIWGDLSSQYQPKNKAWMWVHERL